MQTEKHLLFYNCFFIFTENTWVGDSFKKMLQAFIPELY